MKKLLFISMCYALLFNSSCIKMQHEMSIKPVHITVEIKVKIDKELDDFFGDIDAQTTKK